MRKTKTLPSAPRSATEPQTYKVSEDVLIAGHRPITRPCAGIYNLAEPVSKKAYFTVRGIRQWNTDTAPSGGTVPTGMKAQYDMLVKGITDAAQNREAGKREYTIQQQDSVLLGEQILHRAALREAETYDDLIQQGLTHEEATKIIRDQIIARAVTGKARSSRAYHQQLKEVVHQMAADRSVHVGLPQSLATFAGRFAPNAHFAASGIGSVKAALRRQVHDPKFAEKQSYTEATTQYLNLRRLENAEAAVIQAPMESSLPPASLFSHDRASLQEHLRERGLSTTGTVAELRARLEEATTPSQTSVPVAARTRSRFAKL